MENGEARRKTATRSMPALLLRLWKRTSVAHKRTVILIIIGGAALRAAFLFEPITYDEAFAYLRFTRRPVGEVLSDRSHPLNHVLEVLLSKLTTMLFGLGPWQMRLPAFAAGVLTLPLAYLFVRLLFNRYIALMVLALCAASGPLVEFSAMAHGAAFTWLFFLLALLSGRELVRSDSVGAALRVAFWLALGFWNMPVMIHPAVAVYAWLFIYMASRFDTSLARRSGRVVISMLVFVVLAFLLNAPAIMGQGVAQLFYHPSMGDNTWEGFKAAQGEASIDLWVWFTSSASLAVALCGLLALLFAVYVSTKYRVLVFALVIGTVPMVFLHRVVGPPEQWAWVLYLLHMGSAIALFYLLKQLQARVWPGFSKRFRTALAAWLLFAGFGIMAFRAVPENAERYPEAKWMAQHIARTARKGDRVLAEFPWSAPLQFHLLQQAADPDLFDADLIPPCVLHIVVGPGEGQTPESVLLHNKQPGEHATSAVKVVDRQRLELFTARLER